MTAIRKIPQEWKSWHEELVSLFTAQLAVRGDGPDMTAVRDYLGNEASLKLSAGLDAGLPVDVATFVFCNLPDFLAEDGLTGAQNTPYACLLTHAAPGLAKREHLPFHVARLSEPALARYISLGLRFDDIVGEEALKLWLTRGALFGENAWRARHPRKNPAQAWIEQEGFQLPKPGISDQVVEHFAEAIRDMNRTMTNPVLRWLDRMNAAVDWRLLLALHLVCDNLPPTLRSKQIWNRSFVSYDIDRFHQVFYPEESSHAQLKSHQLRASAPPIEEILRMKERPKTLEDIFALRTPRKLPVSEAG